MIHSQSRKPAARDSAGIRVLDFGEIADAPTPLQIGARALVELDRRRKNLEHELDFRRPYLIARPLSDGRWLALDFARLVMLDSDGEFVRAIGRTGSGPGEFRQLRDFCITAGDTIIGLSLSERRVATFDSSGAHVKTAILDGVFGRSPCLAGGFIILQSIPTSTAPGALEQRASLERVRWDGSNRASIGAVDVQTADLTFSGIANVIGAGERIVVGNGSRSEYRVLNAMGQLLQIVRWNAPATPVTTAMREAAVRTGTQPSRVMREYLPFYRRLAVATDGSVWVHDRYDGVSQSYLVFDSDGLLVGRVHPPTTTRFFVEPVWIGIDRIVLGYRDADGLPHVAIHELIREKK